jgi:hypothetical protein
MATERYYSSIDDTTASLIPDALALVQRGNLIGFFQACGSGYIRSIRWTAELAGVFEFSSSSQTTAREMAADFSLKARGYRESFFRGKLEDHLERLPYEDHDQSLRPQPQRVWG